MASAEYAAGAMESCIHPLLAQQVNREISDRIAIELTDCDGFQGIQSRDQVHLETLELERFFAELYENGRNACVTRYGQNLKAHHFLLHLSAVSVLSCLKTELKATKKARSWRANSFEFYLSNSNPPTCLELLRTSLM